MNMNDILAFINIDDILNNEEIKSLLSKYQNEFIYYMNIIINNPIVKIAISIILIIYMYKKIIKFNENRKLRKIKKEKELFDLGQNKRFTQKNYFSSYKIPDNVKFKFLQTYPKYKIEDFMNIEKTLMDYFWLYIPEYGTRNLFFTIHSKIADDLWHIFSLFPKEYNDFCINSFGFNVKFIPYNNNESFQKILNTYRMLKVKNKTEGFDLDTKYRIENKYNNEFIIKIEHILYKDKSNRTPEENELISSLGFDFDFEKKELKKSYFS
jgi:hypothetical protein